MHEECCKKVEECVSSMREFVEDMRKDNFSKNNINIVMASKIIEEMLKLRKKMCRKDLFFKSFFLYFI